MRDAESRFADSSRGSGASRPLSGGSDADLGPSSSGDGSGARTAPSRVASIPVALTAVAVSLLIFAAAPALAVDPGKAFSFAFAPGGTAAFSAPNGIDVDNSSGASKGSVYVTDTTAHRVEKFDAAGNFLLMFGDGVNETTGGDICPVTVGDVCKAGKSGTAADQLNTPVYIAVDNSSGPSKGDIYVLDTTSKNMHKYEPSGALVTSWGLGGKIDSTSFSPAFTGNPIGIDVDSSGNVYFANSTNPIRYWTFTEEGTAAGSVAWEAPALASAQNNFQVGPDGSTWKQRNTNVIMRSKPSGTVALTITNEGVSGRWTIDSLTGTLYGANFPAGVNEYQFNAGGTPLDSKGIPCAVVLVNNGGGCPPTRSFVSSNILTSPRGIAPNSSTGRLYIVDESKKRVAVYVPGQIPLVTTGEPVTNTKVSGEVKLDGSGSTQECIFEYGTSTSYNLSVPCEPATPYAADKAVTATLTGMTKETLYHYRIVAKGSNGFAYGADKTITPHFVANIKTEPATEVTRTSAKLNFFFEGNGEATTYFFEYGKEASYGSRIPLSPTEEEAGTPAVGEPTFKSATLPGLAYGTLYHFRVVAKNATGTSKGLDRTFETLPAVPKLEAKPATNVKPHKGTLNGFFEGNGEHTTYFYEYGKTTSYTGVGSGKSQVFDAGEPSGPTALEPFELTGLDLEQVYHYRIVATNPVGETKTKDAEFKTLPAVAGLVAIPPGVPDITQEGITLRGEFTGNGDDTHFFFEYGLTTSYGKKSSAEPGQDAEEPVGPAPLAAVITDYEAYSTYHFRVVASNSEGKTVSADKTFETLPAPLPTISGTTSSGVTSTGATLEALINPRRWATVFLFEYGPTTEYGGETEIGAPIGSDHFDHAVSATVSGLEPGTTYHFRAVAINFTGTTYGSDQVFKTPDKPRIDLSGSSSIGQTAAHLTANVSPNSAATTVHFDYGTTPFYGASTANAPIGSDAIDHETSADLTGLTPGITYHFRAVATNSIGTTVGPDLTFTTQALPKPPPPEEKVVKCKRGFVKRHGKCVRKHKKHHRHSTRRHG